MMLLSDRDIRLALACGDLVIEPLEDSQYQPASVDLRLGGNLKHLNGLIVSLTRPYQLRPGEFILGDTLEYMQIPVHLAAQFAGKSSLGRRGLQTHCTAGFIDPGFRGTLTVELSNLSNAPFPLTAGMLIGQICLMKLTTPAQRPYGHPGLGSKYLHQAGPTLAKTGTGDASVS